MEFELCKIDPDTWLRHHGKHHYEHIAVYVKDLFVASKDPKGVTDVLTKKHSFKLKGTGPISYHLGCDFGRDDDGTLHFAPKSMSRQWLIATATC